MAKTDPLPLYERLVATIPEVELKGDKIPYTSVNGHMFSNLTKAGTLALRLPEDVRAAFLAKYKTKLSVEYGIVRKEYVEVPAALLAKTAQLKPYFAKSYAWVKAMKPKPTKRK
jgi:TfoX/Sxy family transcriptional regulator of competence genes